MFKTKEEAAALWCPHARTATQIKRLPAVECALPEGPVANRWRASDDSADDDERRFSTCIGPDCALWIDGKDLGSVPGRGLMGCNPAHAALAARMAGAKTGG